MEDLIFRKVKNESKAPMAKYKTPYLWQAIRVVRGVEQIVMEARTKEGLRRLLYQMNKT